MEAQPPGGDNENPTMGTPNPAPLLSDPPQQGPDWTAPNRPIQYERYEEVEIHLDAMQAWQFSTVIHFHILASFWVLELSTESDGVFCLVLVVFSATSFTLQTLFIVWTLNYFQPVFAVKGDVS